MSYWSCRLRRRSELWNALRPRDLEFASATGLQQAGERGRGADCSAASSETQSLKRRGDHRGSRGAITRHHQTQTGTLPNRYGRSVSLAVRSHEWLLDIEAHLPQAWTILRDKVGRTFEFQPITFKAQWYCILS